MFNIPRKTPIIDLETIQTRLQARVDEAMRALQTSDVDVKHVTIEIATYSEAALHGPALTKLKSDLLDELKGAGYDAHPLRGWAVRVMR